MAAAALHLARYHMDIRDISAPMTVFPNNFIPEIDLRRKTKA